MVSFGGKTRIRQMIRKIINGIFILPVKIYQWTISPLTPNACRYTPTCSTYMIDAIKEWGPIKGIPMGIKRISTCHPLGGSGYDPVPENPKKHSHKHEHHDH